MINRTLPFLILLLVSGCTSEEAREALALETRLSIRHDEQAGTISIFRENATEPLVVQNARPDFRPYLHPIMAPDGRGVLTQHSPQHHPHQTGLYWGFTRLNGRDFFHHPEASHWRRVAATVIEAAGDVVRWQTVYDLLDETGTPMLREEQNWSMQAPRGKIVLDLEWTGEAKMDLTIGKYDYGGLFLRMPWQQGVRGEVVNAARQRNQQAEGKKAPWVDVGMEIEGRQDPAHVAVFDHPQNAGFPHPWRVDGQMGVGPVRARMGDWEIREGEMEIIRHRLVAYAGDLDDVELRDLWKEYSGGAGTAALWVIAQQEARQETFLTPAQAAESMTLLDGFRVNVWASEPMITQPMAFCWDDRGRMWVVENRDYENRQDGFSDSGDSRILILEDTDRDGVADRRKVFLEGIPFPSAIAVGFGGIFLGAPPHLLFVPDRNGDDRADVDGIEIRLTGWGIRDRHETINSLHWGPDGWLYGLEGFATPSKIRKPDGEARLYRKGEPFPGNLLEGEGVALNGGVWRYHPTKDLFEVVAHGFSNPWGIDYDAKGQLFISACVIPHLFHVIPGGLYHRQGGRHFNPYVYSDIQTIVDHRHRSAHGGARVYLSDAFPPVHQGRIFMANIHEHAVLSDVLEPTGSGFVARHGDDFLHANNAQWIGFSLEIGPEGAIYVLDWHDADICGKDVFHKDTGRIFRITPETSQARQWEGRYSDLAKMSEGQLISLQQSPSNWHARRARLILQGRAASGELSPSAHDRLRDTFNTHSNPDVRLRAMWALHLTQGFTSDDLIRTLQDRDEHVRAWAIQLLCEDRSPPREALAVFTRMADRDPSPVVRLYLAAALQRIDPDARWEIVRELLEHGEDAEDPNLPKMIWFAIEPLVAEDPERALELAASSRISVIGQFIARRVVDAGAIETLISRIEQQPDSRLSLLQGMLSGLEGQFDVVAPPNWAPVYARLRQDDEVAELATAVAQRMGDNEAAQQSLDTLQDRGAPPDRRRQALDMLAGQQRKELVEQLPGLLREPLLRVNAIRAIAAFESRDLGRRLLDDYPSFDPAQKLEAVQTMASRPVYGRMLTAALKNGTIPRRDVPAYAARLLRRVVGNGFVEVWGPIDQLSVDQTTALARYKDLLTVPVLAAADFSSGRQVFERLCYVCHKMYGEGGILGPELTGSNRINLDYLLSNVLDPSGEIQDDYKMVMVTTRDGRTYAGNLAVETERRLTLRVPGEEEVVISKAAIQSRERSETSMMPDGLLTHLTDAEVTDLMAYLMTSDGNRD